MMIRIQVLLFSQLKSLAGVSQIALELPEGATIRQLITEVSRLYPALEEATGSILPAQNQEWCSRSTQLQDGDEVALMPPVSGG